MNCKEWLYFATLDMPDGVRSRIQAETLGHVAEAGALQAAEVRDLLGSPRAVNRDLRKLYLTQREWQNCANSDARYGPIDGISVVVWPLLLLWAQVKGTPAPTALPASFWLWLALLIISLITFLAVTQRLHVLRRKQWRYLMIMLSGLAVQWPYFEQGLLGLPAGSASFWAGYTVVLLLLGLSLTCFIRRDQKLSRTIKIEGTRPRRGDETGVSTLLTPPTRPTAGRDSGR